MRPYHLLLACLLSLSACAPTQRPPGTPQVLPGGPVETTAQEFWSAMFSGDRTKAWSLTVTTQQLEPVLRAAPKEERIREAFDEIYRSLNETPNAAQLDSVVITKREILPAKPGGKRKADIEVAVCDVLFTQRSNGKKRRMRPLCGFFMLTADGWRYSPLR